MENPTYIGAIDAFRTTGNRLVPIPVDDDGARVEVIGLLGSSAPVRLVYVIPTFQNPTGAVMPESRRRELARMAARIRLPGRRGPHARPDASGSTARRRSPPSIRATGSSPSAR